MVRSDNHHMFSLDVAWLHLSRSRGIQRDDIVVA
jgi:hypothetical protein